MLFRSITFTPTVDYPNATILIGFADAVITGNTNQKGYAIKEIMLIEGENASVWVEKSPVRFWGGASYDNRENAPFRVLQDGTVISEKGIFGGTFTGKLSIGNIHIEDTNSSKGSIDIKTNNDAETKVHLEEDNSYINSNLKLGSNFVDFNTSNSTLNIKGKTILSNGAYLTTLNDSANILMSSDGVGKHNQKYTEGTMIYNSYGSQKGSDFKFERDNGSSSVKVDINGDLNVKDQITMNNNIAIVARQDSGNSGFDFVVR